jgi:hypothetical protein
MHIIWIATGILLTIFLGLVTIVYLLLVIGLWCQRTDYDKKGGIGL